MQNNRMCKAASILSVLTLIVGLFAVGLATTGCGGGGTTVANVTVVGTALNTSGNAQPNYTVVLDPNVALNGLQTTTTNANGVFAFTVPASAILSLTSQSVTLSFFNPSGNAVLTDDVIPITPAMITGSTINLGNVPNVGPPVSPFVKD